MGNAYCDALTIDVPSLESVKSHTEANTYSMLIVALLERGEPMTLDEVAARFEDAVVQPFHLALRALKRCRPARAPVYRDGDHYALDPHDDELDLWVFRLGLKPPRVPRLRVVPPEPEPLPGPNTRLSVAEVEEAFRGASLSGWSSQRLALVMLDAHGGRMPGSLAVQVLNELTSYHALRETDAARWRGSPLGVQDDGLWVYDPEHPALGSARVALRKRIEGVRKRKAERPDPTVIAVHQRRYREKQAAEAARLAGLRRAILHAFPAKAPEVLTLVDVGEREIATYIGVDIATALQRLDTYEWIGAVDVRALLRRLGFEPRERRLIELGPPKKSRRLNKQGRTLKITTEMLIQGSCQISRPFADPATLRRYLDEGQTTRLRRRMEADAKALVALYQYGRLQGAVRLRWGFLDEMLLVPWAQRIGSHIFELMRRAREENRPLEVVVGSAPGWDDPWARARRCLVMRRGQYGSDLVDAVDGDVLDSSDVQLARLIGEE